MISTSSPSESPSPSILVRWGRALRTTGLMWLSWIVMASLFTMQLVVAGSMEWNDAIKLSSGFWLPWAVWLPVVATLAKLFPIERPHFLGHGLVHGLSCLAIAVCCQLVMKWLPAPTGPPPGSLIGPGEAGPPWRDFERREGPPSPEMGPRERPERADRPDRQERAEGNRPPRMLREAIATEMLSRGAARDPLKGLGRRGGFRATFDVMLYVVIVSLCHAIAWFRRSEQRGRRTLELETSLAQARLQSLRMQLNPHFLFNSLNAISALVHSSPQSADAMISSLSDLLRASLDSTHEAELTLSRELGVLAHYLEIEQTRFQDRLRVQQHISPATEQALVPAFLLQPIVENAVKHGIEASRSTGTITLSSHRDGERLILVIENTGPIVSLDSPSNKSGSGIGLSNSKARLQALYGQDQEVTCTPRPEGGMLVHISLPWHVKARS